MLFSPLLCFNGPDVFLVFFVFFAFDKFSLIIPIIISHSFQSFPFFCVKKERSHKKKKNNPTYFPGQVNENVRTSSNHRKEKLLKREPQQELNSPFWMTVIFFRLSAPTRKNVNHLKKQQTWVLAKQGEFPKGNSHGASPPCLSEWRHRISRPGRISQCRFRIFPPHTRQDRHLVLKSWYNKWQLLMILGTWVKKGWMVTGWREGKIAQGVEGGGVGWHLCKRL